MYCKEGFDSFNNICQKYYLSRNNFFRYLQIRHCVKALFPSFPALPAEAAWEEMTVLCPKKGLICLYSQLMSLENHDLSKIKNGWEGELMVELSDRHWEDALQRINSSSSCACLGLIQFKVVHRAHFSKARLADIYPGTDRSCNRCSLSPADLTHTHFGYVPV